MKTTATNKPINGPTLSDLPKKSTFIARVEDNKPDNHCTPSTKKLDTRAIMKPKLRPVTTPEINVLKRMKHSFFRLASK